MKGEVAVGRHFIDAVHGGKVRGSCQNAGLFVDEGADGEDGFGETVEFGFGVAFGWLDH